MTELRTRFTDSFKKDIVSFTINNPDLTIVEIGKRFNIKPLNISRWYEIQTGTKRSFVDHSIDTKPTIKSNNQKLIDTLINIGVNFTVISTNGITELKIILS